MTEPVVRNAPDQQRYEIVVDGEVAGYSEYHDHSGRRSFTHTVVEPAYEGQGLASTLVRAALDDTREHGLAVLPYCPYVREWLTRHPDYADLVPASERARFDLP